MACINFFSRLRRSRKRDTGAQSTDPTVPQRPQSLQLGLRSSESTAPPLRRQKSEGKQRRWLIQFEPALTVSFGGNRWNSVENSTRSRSSQCQSERIWESLDRCRRSRRCIREQAKSEVDRIRLSRTCRRCIEGIIRCLYSSQICGWRPLCRPKILRCAISLFYQTLTPLTFEPANDGES